MSGRTCSIEGCGRPHQGKGWCGRHYLRWWRNGDPVAPVPHKTTPAIDRIMARAADLDPEVCWPWPGKIRRPSGYGVISMPGRREEFVHRLVLSHKLGRELQAKEECRHSCDTPPCFNPAHLLEGTRQDNIDDMMRRGRHWAQKRKQVLDLAARVG